MSVDHKAEPERVMPVDHKAKAEQFLYDAQGFFWDDDPTQVNLRFAAAQAHATLALVEELRTATLSAVVQRDLAAGFGIPSERLEELDRRLS